MELIIKGKLEAGFLRSNLLSDYQHRFTLIKDSDTAIHDCEVKIVNALNKNVYAARVFIKFSGAVDLRNHVPLLFKLTKYRVHGNEVK